MISSFDEYIIRGCMRCNLGDTPNCKVHRWTKELLLLRSIVLECGLQEVIKWSVPCYTWNDKNVIDISAFKDYCALSFFKGSLLKDERKLLEKPGESSQATRLFKFTDSAEINQIKNSIKDYILEAIKIEKAGLKVKFNINPEPIPSELSEKLENDPIFRSAFESLTKGRQRGYIIHFSQPKQSKTRTARIKKWTDKILNGIGMHDEYKAKKR